MIWVLAIASGVVVMAFGAGLGYVWAQTKFYAQGYAEGLREGLARR